MTPPGFSRSVVRCLAIAGVCGLLANVSRGSAPIGKGGFPPTSATVLRLARSNDGVDFTDTGTIFARYASAPDLVRLSGGGLMALFDYAGSDQEDGPGVMAMSVSNDQGRSWSPLRPIQLRDRHGRSINGWHGDLVVMPSGEFRLFFSTTSGDHEVLTGGKARTLLRSAVTHDGLEYELDHRLGIRLAGRGDLHATVGGVGASAHVYLAGAHARKSGRKPDRTLIQHAVSNEGRRFKRLTPLRLSDVDFVGSIVTCDKGVRAFVTGGDGVRSFLSDDGRKWRPEPGVRIEDGWDPAVVQQKDGSFLMLYCAALDENAVASSQVASATGDPAHRDAVTVTTSRDEVAQRLPAGQDIHATERQGVSDQDTVGGSSTSSAGGAGAQTADALPDGMDATADSAAGSGDGTDSTANGTGSSEESPTGATEDASGPEAGSDGSPENEETNYADERVWDDECRDWIANDADGFPPPPDFQQRIDYIEWYREYALDHPIDNAYDAYATFLPIAWDGPENVPEWPVLRDMFNDGDYDGPPGPWDPADYPEWEASRQATQGLLGQFAEATTHEGYAAPVRTSADGVEGRPASEDLLIGILLPPLGRHRQLARATMANAWRTEDGVVSSDRMLDAWQTTLRGAGHLDRGATIIEDLVSMAERGLVQRNARWALKHGVFSDGELESALDTLREFDRDYDDSLVPYVHGEYAAEMDFAQHMFSPPGPDGEPQYHPGRFDGIFDDDWGKQLDERYAGLGPEDAYATIDAIDAHARGLVDLMRTGYPEVRSADVRAHAEAYRGATPLTQELIPDLSRYYKLNTRNEASRRATQLAYATHLYKAKNGRWPESLDELPAEYGYEMRIDPFTGGGFGYRLGDDGPEIYSAGENGIDDGGIHSPRWDDEITNEVGSDDHVFWPPQPRPKRR